MAARVAQRAPGSGGPPPVADPLALLNELARIATQDLALRPMLRTVPEEALWLLLAGGLSYSAGTVFYLWKRLPYHHAVWHLFVLGGSVCHFFAVWAAIIPRAAAISG